MKKLFILIIAIPIIMSLSACGAGDIGSDEYNQKMASSNVSEAPLEITNFDAYENNLQGLINCLKDNSFIQGDPTTMSAALIGAKEGYRYQFPYENSNVTVELYEYDTQNLDNIAKNIFQQINSTGEISIQEKSIPVTISQNGKFLMIYTYDRENDANITRKQTVENLLKRFKS